MELKELVRELSEHGYLIFIITPDQIKDSGMEKRILHDEVAAYIDHLLNPDDFYFSED